MGTLWIYYRIALKDLEESIFFRLTGEVQGRIFGFEVDESGKAVRKEDGGLRFRVFDRDAVAEMKPLALFGGRLVPGETLSAKDPRLEPT